MSRITQKGSTGAVEIQSGGSFQTSTDINLATLVGTRWDLSDGREVMLVSNGSLAIASPGVLVQDAANIANHSAMAVTTGGFTAYSANGNQPATVVATAGATLVTVNQYQGGFLTVESGIGIGQTLRVASHAAAVSSGTFAITLEDSPNTALTSASVVSLYPPHGANVILAPTTPSGAVVGATLYPLTAGLSAGSTGTPFYGFVVTKGQTAAVSDASAPLIGAQLQPSVTTAGNVMASNGTGGALIGYAIQAGSSAKAREIFINV